MGISYLTAISESLGHDIKALALNSRNIVSEAEEYEPDLIAFGATTGFHRKYLELLKPLKERLGTPVVIGGSHPTFFPEVMEENLWLDFAIRGEADIAFPLFLKAFSDEIPFSDTGNMIYREKGKIIESNLLPLIEDLDSIPFPKRNLLPNANRKAIFCITGRGCPYNCTYCFNHTSREMYKGLGRYCNFFSFSSA